MVEICDGIVRCFGCVGWPLGLGGLMVLWIAVLEVLRRLGFNIETFGDFLQNNALFRGRGEI